MAKAAKEVMPNRLEGVRKYKHAENNLYGFAPYERRVIMTIMRKGKPDRARWFVRLETARRRAIDIAMDNCRPGDKIEVAHVRGLQFFVIKVKVGGFDMIYNKEVFTE